MALVGDRERDGAARELGRQYADGRIDEQELSERLDVILRARSSWEIAYALRRLPRFETLVAHVRHIFLLAAVSAVWLMLSTAVLIAFVAWVAAHEVTVGALFAFLLAWLLPSGLLYRRAVMSRRRLQHRI